jgi:hypothetical protein
MKLHKARANQWCKQVLRLLVKQYCRLSEKYKKVNSLNLISSSARMEMMGTYSLVRSRPGGCPTLKEKEKRNLEDT